MGRHRLLVNRYLFFSKPSFWFFLPISVLAVPISYRSSDSQSEVLSSFVVGLIATFSIYPLYILLIKGLHSRRLPNIISIKVTSLITLGITRGVVIYLGSELFLLDQPINLIARILNSSLTTLAWLGIFSVIIEVNSRYRRRYQALMSQLLISNFGDMQRSGENLSLSTSKLSNFQLALRNTYLTALGNPSLHKGASAASVEIFSQVELNLKPIMNEIWDKSLKSTPKFNSFELLKRSITNFQIDKKLFFTFFIFTSIFNFPAAFGVKDGLIIAFTSSILLYLLNEVRSSLSRRFSHTGISLNLFFLLSIGFLTAFIPYSLVLERATYKTVPFLLLLGLFISILLLAFSVLHHGSEARSLIIQRLRSEISKREIDNLPTVLQSSPSDFQLASYLHNSLQSEILSIAYELGEAAKDPFAGRVESALERFSSVVERSLESDFIEYLESPQERYLKVVESWSSIVSIEIDVDKAIFEDSVRVSVFVQFIQEAIANSVRRGGATEIRITGAYSEGIFKVEVVDNGGISSAIGKGIGRTWVDRLSISKWDLENDGGRTSLKVEF
jgi:hypothetical protein